MKFNLTGLREIYAEALRRQDPTLVFELVNGRGRFIFLMFFSSEDKESKDRLFIYLKNTNKFIELKAYGSHRLGDFFVYFSEENKDDIVKELQLTGNGGVFSFEQFMLALNQQIPITLPLQNKLDKMREIWPQVMHNLSKVIDQAEKTKLIGIKSLPEGQNPRDKTLRKLYTCTNGNAQAIENLITALRVARVTLAWTARQDVAEKSFAEIMTLINAQQRRRR